MFYSRRSDLDHIKDNSHPKFALPAIFVLMMKAFFERSYLEDDIL